MNIRFYTTLGCHLCEEALSMIHLLQEQNEFLSLKEIEIANSNELIRLYGIRVPVIAREDDEEINWPFTLNELRIFLDT